MLTSKSSPVHISASGLYLNVLWVFIETLVSFIPSALFFSWQGKNFNISITNDRYNTCLSLRQFLL